MWNQSFDAVFGHMFLSFGCGIVVWNCSKTKWYFSILQDHVAVKDGPEGWSLRERRLMVSDGIGWTMDGLVWFISQWCRKSQNYKHKFSIQLQTIMVRWNPLHGSSPTHSFFGFGVWELPPRIFFRIWDCEPSSSFLKVPRVISTQVSELVGVMSWQLPVCGNFQELSFIFYLFAEHMSVILQ